MLYALQTCYWRQRQSTGALFRVKKLFANCYTSLFALNNFTYSSNADFSTSIDTNHRFFSAASSAPISKKESSDTFCSKIWKQTFVSGFFLAGTKFYTRTPSSGSVFWKFCKCIWSACKNRWRSRSSDRKERHWLDYADAPVRTSSLCIELIDLFL